MIDINSYSKPKESGGSVIGNFGGGGGGTASSLSSTHTIFGIPGNYARKNLNGDASISGTLSVIKDAQFFSDVSIGKDTYIHGNLEVEGDASFGALNAKDLNVEHLAVDALDASTLKVSGDTTIEGNTTIGGNTIMNGTVWANEDLRVSGELRYGTAIGREMTVDRLQVEGSAHFFELTIDEVKSVGGRVIISAANAVVDLAEEGSDYYNVYFAAKDGDGNEVKNQFETYDMVVYQTFNVAKGTNYNVDNRYYWCLVTAVSSQTVEKDGKEYWMIKLSKTDKAQYSNAAPQKGDKICQLGNKNSKERGSAIILSAYHDSFLDAEIQAPSIVQYNGINDYDLSKFRNSVISNGKNHFTGSFSVVSSNGSVLPIEDYVDDISDSKTPFIGDGNDGTDKGYWYVWDKILKRYVNSGILAEGLTGVSDRLHIAWAESIAPKGTPKYDPRWIWSRGNVLGRKYKYIGTYTDTVIAEDSDDPNDYDWVDIQGIDGSTGAKGADGSFTHIAWCTEVGRMEGGVEIKPFKGFTTTKTEAAEYPYIGTFVDGNVADSNNPYDYNWVYIKGEKGEKGDSIKILGTLNSADELPASGNVADAYLINGDMWVWDGISWQNVGKIQGPQGVSNYIHMAWMNERANADGSFTTLNPDNAVYKYMGTCVNEQTEDPRDWRDYKWVCIQGAQGDEPLTLDFDDEMTQVVKDAAHNLVNPNWQWTTHAHLTRNGKAVNIKSYTVDLEGLTLVTKSVNGNQISVTVKNPSSDTGKISLTAVDTDGREAHAVATTFSTYNGKTTPVYQLLPTNNIISIDNQGDYYPQSIGCEVSKTHEGRYTIVEDLAAEGLSISVYRDGSSIGSSLPVYLNQAKPQTSLRFDLKKDGVLVDKETLVVVLDGKDGTSITIKGTKNNSSELPSTAIAGDAYLINGELWVYDGSKWTNVGNIQGPQGTTYYYHIAYANSATGKDFCATDNPKFVDGTPYKYQGTCTNTDVNDPIDWRDYKWVSIQGETGAAGQDALLADFDDEMYQVPCRANGSIIASNFSWTTNVHLRKGTESVAITNVTLEKDGVNASYKIVNGVCQVTITNLTKDIGKVTAIVSGSDGKSAAATATINKVYGGENGESPIVYQLVPSENAVKINKDGNYNVVSVTAQVEKVVGDTRTIVNPSDEGISCKAYTDGTYRNATLSIVLSNYKPTTSVKFEITKDSVLLDRETVPIVIDGIDGEDGNDGENAVTADFDNEMDSIVTDNQGNFSGSVTLYTNVKMYAGTTELPLTSLTCSSATGVTASPTVSSGRIAFSVTKSVADKQNVIITAKAKYNNKEYTRQLTFTITKLKTGADGETPEIYSLNPSVSAIKVSKDGTYAQTSMYCDCLKTVGTTISKLSSLPNGWSMKYKIDDNGQNAYTVSNNLTISSAKKSVTFYLYYNSSTLVDTETIPVITDGSDGLDGTTNYLADFSDDFETVACDEKGNPINSSWSWKSSLYMYYGKDKVVPYNVTTKATGLTVSSCTKNLSGGYWDITVNKPTQDNCKVQATAYYKDAEGKEHTAMAVMTVAKVKAGANGETPTLYKLVLSSNSIKLGNDSKYNPTSITVTAQKVEGSKITNLNTTSAISNEGLKLVGYVDSTSSHYNLTNSLKTNLVQTISTYKPTNYIKFELQTSQGVVWDYETVPVVKDGNDGQSIKGDPGTPGADGLTTEVYQIRFDYGAAEMTAEGDIKLKLKVGLNLTKGTSTSAVTPPNTFTCSYTLSDFNSSRVSNKQTLSKSGSVWQTNYGGVTTHSISSYSSLGFASKDAQRSCSIVNLNVEDNGTVIAAAKIPIQLEKGFLFEIDKEMGTLTSTVQDSTKKVNTLDSNYTDISNKYSSLKQSVDGLSTTVGNHTTTLNGLGNTYASKSDVSSIKQTTDSINSTVKSHTETLNGLGNKYASKTELSEIKQTATSISSKVTTIDSSIGKIVETGIDITNKKIEMKADKFILKNNSGTKVLSADSQGNLEITGKINATSGKIAGLNIANNNSLTNEGLDTNASIILSNTKNGTHAAIGDNTLVAGYGYKAVARFENTDKHPNEPSSKSTINKAAVIKASGAAHNYAITGEGNTAMKGFIEGYLLNSFTPTSTNNTIQLEKGKYVVVTCTNSSYTTVYLPTLSEVRTALDAGGGTYFAVEMTIVGGRNNTQTFTVYGGSGSSSPYFVNPDNGSTGYSVRMAKGDTIKVLLTYDGSYYAYLLSHLD